MSVYYLALSQIRGSFVFVKKTANTFLGEGVELILPHKQFKHGYIVALEQDMAIIQVIESTVGLSLGATKIKLTGLPLLPPLADTILGRVFSPLGCPLDGLGYLPFDITSNSALSQSTAYSRIKPSTRLTTGIDHIDENLSFQCGQSLSLFFPCSEPLEELCLCIFNKAMIKEHSPESLCILFGGIGLDQDTFSYLTTHRCETSNYASTTLYLSQLGNSFSEWILTPQSTLTAAEYLAHKKQKDVLVILGDFSHYLQALHENTSFQNQCCPEVDDLNFFSKILKIYDHAGCYDNHSGSITLINLFSYSDANTVNSLYQLTSGISDYQVIL